LSLSWLQFRKPRALVPKVVELCVK
jgi:hypothetical protein